MLNFIIHTALPWLIVGAITIMALLIAKSKLLFGFLPDKSKAVVGADIEVIAKLIKIALHKGQKQALYAIIRTALQDGKLSKTEIIAIIQATIHFVENALDAETRARLSAKYGEIGTIITNWAKEIVFSWIEKQLAKLGLRVDLDGSDGVSLFHEEVNLRQMFYRQPTNVINESNYQQEAGVRLPIADSQDIILGLKANQDWRNRIWKAMWKIKF